MNTTTKSNSKEFIEIPSNSTMAKNITVNSISIYSN